MYPQAAACGLPDIRTTFCNKFLVGFRLLTQQALLLIFMN
jgi:hypothetical protein